MPWKNEAPLATARQLLAAATCDAPAPGSGYRIYALGGSPTPGTILATVEAYDTSTGAWSPIGAMPTAREALAATSGPGRLYALGGDNGSGALATHEIYDPAAGTWAAAPPLPTARSGLAAVTGRDGSVYAIGGYNGAYLGTVEAFDPATNAWTARASMPNPRYYFAAVTGPDGLIYAIGGRTASATLANVEIFNPATNAWTTGSPLPAARAGLAAAVGPDGLIYAFGGVDLNNIPQATVYSYNPVSAGPWITQASLLSPQGFLAGDTGPDGLVYAIGGQNFLPVSTVEALTVATAVTAPDPYIGNGTYQSPDIILLDASGDPIPIGGAPGGAWDTLLQPNKHYGIQAVVYNDSTVAATTTTVRFWHFSGGVGAAGAQIDVQTVTVPPNGSIVVTSAQPFQSGAAGQHECVAVSIANAASAYFNVDPMTAAQVIDPTVPHPAGSGHFGSAWRNTNSVTIGGAVGAWRFPFQANIPGREPVNVKLVVKATKVPAGWERTAEVAKLRQAFEGAGAQLRLPVFLVPELRAQWPAADLDLKILVKGGKEPGGRPKGTAESHVTVHPGQGMPFTVSGTIPRETAASDIFLVDVAAHYPAASGGDVMVVQYLEVIYLKR